MAIAQKKRGGLLFPEPIVQEALGKKETWDNFGKFLLNHQWLTQNLKQLKKDHSGKVIIILDKQVVSESEDMKEILKAIRALPNPNEAYVRYIPSENELLLL